MTTKHLRPLIVVGLGYGDEGKGTTVDAMVRKMGYNIVVRFNGGAQAAHHVYTDDGARHCFAQFGSGSLVPGVRTLLSRCMLVKPDSLFIEGDLLVTKGQPDIFKRLAIDPRALIITPYHVLINRLEEEARCEKHGTCGMGIGATARDGIEAPEDAIRARHALLPNSQLNELMIRLKTRMVVRHPQWLKQIDDVNMNPFIDDLRKMGEFITQPLISSVRDMLCANGVIFEGAQGLLLDEDYGTHPYTTWSRTTPANAVQLLRESGNNTVPSILGVSRTFHTRHGAGPIYGEQPDGGYMIADDDNVDGRYQGKLRVGYIDWTSRLITLDLASKPPMTRMRHFGPAGRGWIALTHADKQWHDNHLMLPMDQWRDNQVTASATVAELRARGVLGLVSRGKAYKDKTFEPEFLDSLAG